MGAEFEQRVLYGRGPAQVGFGLFLSSFHCLTLSPCNGLSPEPLRLTHPSGVRKINRDACHHDQIDAALPIKRLCRVAAEEPDLRRAGLPRHGLQFTSFQAEKLR